MRKLYRSLSAIFIVFVVYYISVSAAMAGSGTYTDGTPDTIELHAMFMYDEACFSSASCPDWEKLFKEGSKLLYNATEKQVKLSKIYFYKNCPEADQKMDVKIYNDNRGASAHRAGLGTAGSRIRLSQAHKTVTTAGAGNRGQLGFVHEMGHFVFSLGDEYEDKSSNQTADAYCIENNSGTTASIMDSGTTVTTTNQRTEFCWSGNHRTGKTEQDKKRTIGGTDYEDKDSWTWIKAFVKNKYGADLTLPTATPTSDTSGHTDPTFEYYNCGVRAVVCIDRSGSMSSDSFIRALDGAEPYESSELALKSPHAKSPISIAKQGTKNFINILGESDRAAVVSYSSSVTTDYAMNVMSSANKTAAKTAIDTIFASGSTNIGGGLEASLSQITGDGNRMSNEVIVLLSDGQHNTGTDPDSVLPSLKSRGVTVHTIGLGSVDASLMSRIASETGGTYLYANSAAALNSHLINILKDLRNNGLVEKSDGELVANEAASLSTYVDGAVSSSSAQFVLSWDATSTEFAFNLFRPNGSQVNTSDSDVTYIYDADSAYKEYEISTPAQGDWSVQISNPSTANVIYTYQVHSAPSDVIFSASSNKGEYTFPEKINVKGTITAGGEHVGGASVTAKVTRPNGNFVNIQLYDDGSELHGDAAANDGVYSSNFLYYNGSGSYTFDVAVNTEGGFTVDNAEAGGTFTSVSVGKGTRESQFSVVVNGTSIPTLDIQANNLNGSVSVIQGSSLSLTISLNPGSSLTLKEADWYLAAVTPSGEVYYYNVSQNQWLPGFDVSYQGPLVTLSSVEILNVSNVTLPVGTYTIYFGFDLIKNGVLDTGPGEFDYDTLELNIKN